MSDLNVFSISGLDDAALINRLAVVSGLGLLIDDLLGRKGEQWLLTSAAAFYCMDRTGRSDIDWHSLLRENRRTQLSVDDLIMPVVSRHGRLRQQRGNSKRLGALKAYKLSGRVYYAVSDLNQWLQGLPSQYKLM